MYERHGNLFVVGDPDQSIYLFRGAEPTLFNKLEEYIPNLKTIFMVSNYRSTDEIVKVSDEVIKLNKNRIAKHCNSMTGNGEKVRLLVQDNEEDLVAQEVGIIKGYINKGRKPSDIAVLYRSVADKTRNMIIEQLKAEGIPVVYEPTKDVIYDYALNICKYDYTKDKNFVSTAVDLLIEDKSRYNSVARTVDTEKVADKIKGNLSLDISDTLLDVLAELGVNSKTDKQTARAAEEAKFIKKDGMNTIANAVAYWEKLNDTEKEALCKEVDSLETDDNLDITKGVVVITMHKSKGLEFPIVFINGLNTAVFSNEKSYGEVEEEARLAYVAYSRAKEQLYLGYAKEVQQKVRDGRGYVDKVAATNVHGILAQIMDNENVVQELPDSNYNWDTNTIKQEALQRYNESMSKYYTDAYTPMIINNNAADEIEVKGYRYTTVQKGEIVGYQASIEGLKKYNCVPNDKYLTITITKPLVIREIKDKHLYAFDEMSKTIRIYDCTTEEEIKAVFGTASNDKLTIDIKDSKVLESLAEKAESRVIPKKEVVEKKVDTVEDVDAEKGEVAEKKAKTKIVYHKLVNRDTGRMIGIRVVKEGKRIDVPMEEIRDDNEQLKVIMKQGVRKDDIKVTVKCSVTYEEFVDINKKSRAARKEGVAPIILLRILEGKDGSYEVERVDTKAKMITTVDALVDKVLEQKVCLTNPSALVQWNKWKE